MKTVPLVAFLFLLSVVSLSSCSKKSDDVTPGATTTPGQPTSAQVAFQVKIDGKVYAPDFAYGLASFPGNDGYYAIYGLDSKTSDVVAIALPSTATEGTHPLSKVSVGIITLNKEDFTTVNGGSGTVTITKKTATSMVGTFSFTAYDATGTKKLTLTEGKFNVNVR